MSPEGITPVPCPCSVEGLVRVSPLGRGSVSEYRVYVVSGQSVLGCFLVTLSSYVFNPLCGKKLSVKASIGWIFYFRCCSYTFLK